eukprot:7319633-Alexandrium_andersonii.AAC.1
MPYGIAQPQPPVQDAQLRLHPCPARDFRFGQDFETGAQVSPQVSQRLPAQAWGGATRAE